MREKPVRLLISLDSLLDTRLGTIALINPQSYAELLLGGFYPFRFVDHFNNVDNEEFKKRYTARNKENLRKASLTAIYNLVLDFVKKTAKLSLNTPASLTPEIHINMYPYDLNEKERKVIINRLKGMIPLQPEIKIVNYTLEELNPLFVRATYQTMILYEGSQWLDIHTENKLLEKYPIPLTTLFIPLKSEVIFDEPLEKLYQALTALEEAVTPIINLQFLPLVNFSSIMCVINEKIAKEFRYDPITPESDSPQEGNPSDPTAPQKKPDTDPEDLRSEAAPEPQSVVKDSPPASSGPLVQET